MIPRFVRPTIAVVLAAAIGVLALTGCGSNARSTTTGAEAHRQILHYLQETADTLPVGTRLSATIPWGRVQSLHPGQLPGDMDDESPEQPYSYYISMWVLLPGAGEDDPLGVRAQDVLTSSWRPQGYSVEERDDDVTMATTSDGYLIHTQLSVQNILSVTVSSPDFPKSQLDRDLPWPSEVTPAVGH